MKKKFKITDMHCSSCALTIDMDLEELEGVSESRTSYAKAETEIEFDPQKISEELILQTIKQAGYTAVPYFPKNPATVFCGVGKLLW